MRTRPEDLTDDDLRDGLARGWGFDAASLTYEPVGFGSHHWTAATGDGARRFVTVDDLGVRRRDADDTTDAAFVRLTRALETAHGLREDAGIAAVVAPLSSVDGDVVTRLHDRYSLAVHPFVEGRPAGAWGEYERGADRLAVLDVLVQVHAATATVGARARSDDGVVPNRDVLARATAAGTDRPWRTGPYGEPTRALLAEHAAGVARLFDWYDEVAPRVLDPRRFVITHGEPHAGNVLLDGDTGAPRLVDWDTALLAPPERDLWDLDAGDRRVLDAHERRTGVAADPDALAFYRMWFDLCEIAGYVALFFAPHEETADVAESWRNLQHFLRPADRWPEIVGR